MHDNIYYYALIKIKLCHNTFFRDFFLFDLLSDKLVLKKHGKSISFGKIAIISFIFRWGTHLYLSLFLSSSVHLSVRSSCTISQKSYIIWSYFLVHMCKVMISPGFFFIFSKFRFFALLGGSKGKKWPKTHSVAPFISGTMHHMIFIYATHV